MCPNVNKEEYDLIDLTDDGKVTYMEKDGNYNESLTIDPSTELYEQIKKDMADTNFNVLVSICTAMDISMVVSHRKE